MHGGTSTTPLEWLFVRKRFLNWKYWSWRYRSTVRSSFGSSTVTTSSFASSTLNGTIVSETSFYVHWNSWPSFDCTLTTLYSTEDSHVPVSTNNRKKRTFSFRKQNLSRAITKQTPFLSIKWNQVGQKAKCQKARRKPDEPSSAASSVDERAKRVQWAIDEWKRDSMIHGDL
jgi:hypothetical protein